MPKKVVIPTFQDVLSLLDLTKIGEAITNPRKEGEPRLRFDLDETDNITEMLLSAIERWLPRDLVEFQIEGVESRAKLLVGPDEVKGFLDVSATMNGLIKPFDSYKGQRIIIDWKTSEGNLDTRWKNRLVDSWQWRIYSLMEGAALFNYRGISRQSEDKVNFGRDVIIEVPKTNTQEVEEYVTGLLLQRNGLINIGATVWPRNMPDACNKYNRVCPFKGECDTYTMPRYTLDIGKVMSYTEFERFITCPERSRRLAREPRIEDADTSIGTGFHNGIAEVYRQAKEIKL